MRIALLADFPVHALPGFEDRPSGHHATWLPPLARELEAHAESADFHWITCTKAVTTPLTLHAWNQTFHLLPRGKLSLEMLTGFRRERRLISRLLDELKPDLVHAWGTEQGYGYAAIDFQGPSILSLQGILQSCCKVAAMPWLTRLQATHEARVLRQAKHLTVESPWGKSQLQPLAPHATIDLLEYGADPACFEIQRSLSPSSFPSPNPQSTFDNQQSSISPPPPSSSTDLRPSTFRPLDREASSSPNPPTPPSTPLGTLGDLAVQPSNPAAEETVTADRAGSTRPCLEHRTSNVEHATSKEKNIGQPPDPVSSPQSPIPSASPLQCSTLDVQSSTFNTPLALFVGSLSLLKGVDTLLDAFSDPRLRHVDLVVLGAGDPALTRRALPPNIHLLGHRPPAEVREWMAQAWCLVHPTRADTSPNCVKEARVIGLPVVTTPNGGQTQYVQHGKSGFIHPAGDTEGLIQGVLTVTESQETSLKMGGTGQAECRATLTPAATAARLLEIYQTLQNR